MKSRNQLKLVVALVMAACAGIASAEQFQDNAQVTGSQPIFAQGNCSNNGNQTSGGTSFMGSAIGAVAGGLLGNQIGGGNGRTAATAVGAVVGGLTGNHLAQGSNTQGASNGGDCGNRLVGYTVNYEYRGQRFQTQMAQAPGNTIPVQVDLSVRPLVR